MGLVDTPFRLKAAVNQTLLQVMYQIFKQLRRMFWPAPKGLRRAPVVDFSEFQGKRLRDYSCCHLPDTGHLLRTHPAQEYQGQMQVILMVHTPGTIR